jgi:hypothetical protein
MAHENPASFEIAVGAGSSLNNNIDSWQVLISPSVNRQIGNIRSLWFRIEGDVEVIHCEGKETVVAGIAPMLRLFPYPGQDSHGPFIEAGFGANIISRHAVAYRELGGTFIISTMAGVGYGFQFEGKAVSLSLRYRHISNGHLYPQNYGFDSCYLMVSVGF